jgi:hypothetical protein
MYRPASSDSYVGDRFWLHSQPKFISSAPGSMQDFIRLESQLDNDLRMPMQSRRSAGSLHAEISPNDNDRRLTSCSSVDLRHWITHPKLTTDERRFGYRGFKRKVSFFGLDGPSMPNPGGIHIFHGASDVGSADVTVKKVWRFRPVDRRGTAPVALHNKTALIDQDLFIDNVSSMTPATASISPSA